MTKILTGILSNAVKRMAVNVVTLYHAGVVTETKGHTTREANYVPKRINAYAHSQNLELGFASTAAVVVITPISGC